MKLLTQEIKKTIPALYSQEEVDDPLCVVKFFHPFHSWTWYVIEGEELIGQNTLPDGETDWCFFGYVDSPDAELGYFSLSELATVNIAGLGMERDMYWTPITLSQVKAKHDNVEHLSASNLAAIEQVEAGKNVTDEEGEPY